MPDVFISYSREDQATASRFAEELRREGFEVWWDQTLRSGEAYDEVTEQALRSARAVVVLWSRASAASRWVRAEATIADRNGTLVPAMIEACDRPVMFELRQTAELTNWNGDAGDRAWQLFVDDLRQKLGKGPGGPRESVPVVQDRPKGRKPVAAMALVALLAMAGVAAWWLWGRADSGAVSASVQADRTEPIKLAILPFTDLSADASQSVWARGLAEDLATQLQQVGPALRVYGTESTGPLEEKNNDPREIARLLGADYLLRAAVQGEGAMVRVTMRLMDGKDGAIIWSSQPYQREVQDVFTLQQEIATDVARKAGVVLDITVPRALGGTNNVAAFELYLRALDTWRRGEGTLGGWTSQFREATRLDPGYMQAWYLLYIFQLNPVFQAAPDQAREIRAERARAAAQLQKLPADSVLSLQFQAMQAAERHDWAAALSLSERASQISPVRDSVYGAASYRLMTGQVSDAIGYLKRSLEAEPLNLEISWFLQMALTATGRHEEALAEAARIKALGLETAPERQNPVNRAEVIEELSRNDPRPGRPWQFWVLADELASILPDEAALRRRLTAALSAGASPMDNRNSALAHIAMGWQSDQIYPALRRAMAGTPESILVMRLTWVTNFASILPRDLRKQLLRDLGLVDYWRQSGNWGDFCHPTTGDDFECFDAPAKPGA